MKHQALFSSPDKKGEKKINKIKMSSAVILLGALGLKSGNERG